MDLSEVNTPRWCVVDWHCIICVCLPLLTNITPTHSVGSLGVMLTKTPSSLAERSEPNSTFRCCLRKDGKCGRVTGCGMS
jgi:hypothetical protein